jgi:hypothetical protein
MNAEKAPNERQSLNVLGLVKLNAKTIKMAEFMTTIDHNPYTGASSIVFSFKSTLSDDPYFARRHSRDHRVRHETNARRDKVATGRKAEFRAGEPDAPPRGKMPQWQESRSAQGGFASANLHRWNPNVLQ